MELYPNRIRTGDRTVPGPRFLMYGLGLDVPGTVEERTHLWYSHGSAATRGRI
jgi:hypothetical protein